MQVIITDAGEPGTNDKYAVTVWNSANRLFHSSNWVSVKTVKQVISGGNIVIQGSTSVIKSGLIADNQRMQVFTELSLKALPNPSTTNFILQLSSSVKAPISMKVFNITGSILKARTNLSAGQTIRLGDTYQPGVYIVQIQQGNQTREVKLIKLPD